MSFWSDDRGAAIQVGAIVLFAFVIIAITAYQASVVPSQNEEIEYNHNQRLQSQLQELEGAIGSLPATRDSRTVTVDLSTSYPERTIFINPPRPTGRLQTVGTTNETVAFEVRNATAANPDVADFWNGTTRNYSTGGVAYRPNYHVYGQAPVSVVENSLVYNEFADATIPVNRQSMFDGDRVSLVALQGSFRKDGGTASMNVRPVSASTTTVTVEATGSGNVTISTVSRLRVSRWRTLIDRSDEYYDQSGHVYAVTQNGTTTLNGEKLYRIEFELEQGQTYDLQLARAGIGTLSAAEKTTTASYALAVTDRITTEEDTNASVTVEVRDRYDNPKSGVTVNATVDPSGDAGGTVANSPQTTDENGRVTFTYDATANVDNAPSKSDTVRVSFAGDTTSGFDESAPENVTAQVTVKNTDGSPSGGGGGGGAYTITFDKGPSDDWNVSTDGSSRTLVASTGPEDIEGASTDFAVNDSSVATVASEDAETNATGDAEVTLTAQGNGDVAVYVGSSGSSDVINVTVTDVGGTGTPPTITNPTLADDGDGVVNDGDAVTVSADVSDDGSVSSVEADVSQFGGSSTLGLTDGNGDGTYNRTFTVDETSAASDGDYAATITATDDESNTATATTNTLTLDTTAPSLSNAKAIDVTDGDGVVGDGDTVNVTVDVADARSGVSTVTADASSFGGPSSLTLADAEGDGTYYAEFQVDESASSDGTYDVPVSATDGTGNGGSTTTNALTLDTSGPALTNAVITDDTNGDGNVTTDDTVNVSVDAADPDGISSVTADATDFGGPGSLTLEDPDGDGTYNATFTVESDGSATDGDQNVTVTATDNAGDTASTDTNALTVDVTAPTVSSTSIADATDADGTVATGDAVDLAANVSDAGTGVDTVTADASAFGAGTVTLGDNGDGTYSTTFTVGSGATEGDQTVDVTAIDYVNNATTSTTNSLTVANAPTDLSVDSNRDATNGTTTNVSISYTEANPDTVSLTLFDGSGNNATFSNSNDSAYAGDNTEHNVSIDLSSPDSETGNGIQGGTNYSVELTATDTFTKSGTSVGPGTVNVTASQANQIQLTPNVTSAGGSGKYEFELENTGNKDVSIVAIAINDSSNGNAIAVDNNQATLTKGQGNTKADLESSRLPIGGTKETLDQSTGLNVGQTKTYEFRKFEDSSGQNVDMSADSITVTFYFSDGSSVTVTMIP